MKNLIDGIHLYGDVWTGVRIVKNKPGRFKFIQTHCSTCNDIMYCRKDEYRIDKHNFCSRGCRRSFYATTSKTLNYGEKFDRRGGRVMIYMPEHRKARKDGYVSRSRVVMEAAIGRPLTSDEQVHHIDHDKINDDIDNLDILTQQEHTQAHDSLDKCIKKLLKIKALVYDKISKKYYVCGH